MALPIGATVVLCGAVFHAPGQALNESAEAMEREQRAKELQFTRMDSRPLLLRQIEDGDVHLRKTVTATAVASNATDTERRDPVVEMAMNESGLGVVGEPQTYAEHAHDSESDTLPMPQHQGPQGPHGYTKPPISTSSDYEKNRSRRMVGAAGESSLMRAVRGVQRHQSPSNLADQDRGRDRDRDRDTSPGVFASSDDRGDESPLSRPAGPSPGSRMGMGHTRAASDTDWRSNVGDGSGNVTTGHGHGQGSTRSEVSGPALTSNSASASDISHNRNLNHNLNLNLNHNVLTAQPQSPNSRSQTTMSHSEAAKNRRRAERKIRDKFESIRAEFETMLSKKSGSGFRLSASDDIRMYSLAMQGSQGDVKGLRPGMFDGISRKRYSAWKKLRGTPQRWAQEDYIVAAVTIMEKLRAAGADAHEVSLPHSHSHMQQSLGQSQAQAQAQAQPTIRVKEQKQRRLPHRRSVTPNSFVRPNQRDSVHLHDGSGVASDGEGEGEGHERATVIEVARTQAHVRPPMAAGTPTPAPAPAPTPASTWTSTPVQSQFDCTRALRRLVEVFSRSVESIGLRTGHLSPYDAERVMTELQDAVGQHVRAAELVERGASVRGARFGRGAAIPHELISLRMIAMYLDVQGAQCSQILREMPLHSMISYVVLDFIGFLGDYHPERYIESAQHLTMSFTMSGSSSGGLKEEKDDRSGSVSSPTLTSTPPPVAVADGHGQGSPGHRRRSRALTSQTLAQASIPVE